MNDSLKTKLASKDKWLRLVYMVLFLAIMYLVCLIVLFITLFQFLSALFTDKPNDRVMEFSQKLNTYIYQMLCFLTYNTEYKPFPFGAWPNEIKAIQIDTKE